MKQADDDGEWEDVPDTRLTQESSETSNALDEAPLRSSTPRSATRRRKVGKTIFIAAQPSPAVRRPAQAQRPRRRALVNFDREQMQDALAHGLAASVRYFGSVLTDAFWFLRKPLGVLAALWLLALIMAQLSSTLHAAFLAPVCKAPIISSSSLCRPSPTLNVPQRADFPRLVEIQNNNFDQLLDSTAGGKALSLDIKNAEIATRDLVTLVKVSDLKSRELIASSLNEFIDKAKKAGRGLLRLNSKINSAVDQ